VSAFVRRGAAAVAGAWFGRWKAWSNIVDRTVIVLLVFVAF